MTSQIHCELRSGTVIEWFGTAHGPCSSCSDKYVVYLEQWCNKDGDCSNNNSTALVHLE